MRNLGTLFATLACAALLSPLSASTADAGDYGKSGGYIGLNGAYGLDLFSTDIANAVGAPPLPVRYEDSWGLNARLGYRLASLLALEVQYEWMQGIDIIATDNTLFAAGTTIGTWKPHTLTGNLKLYLPIWRVQPYLLAGGGVGIWSIELSPAVGSGVIERTGFAFRGGAGLDFYLTESLALNGEGTAVLNTADFTSPLNFSQTSLYYFSISAGFSYHF